MHTLVLGGTGMLGHKMFQILRQRNPDTFCSIRESLKTHVVGQLPIFQQGNVIDGLDATDFSALEQMLLQHKPRVIVNCIGVIKQRADAKSAVPSITINALLPHKLAVLCQSWGGTLIHFSTDCVFSGKQGHYREDDFADATDMYGRTKFLGEVACENALTLRTSIIGRELQHSASLLEWFLSQNHGAVQGYSHAMFTGVTTNWLAETVATVIEKQPSITGLYQVASEPISKFQLLKLLKDAFRLDIEIIADNSFRCDRSLHGEKFVAATALVTPQWPQLVTQLAADATPYHQWRSLIS